MSIHNPHKPNTPPWYAYEAGRASILDITVQKLKEENARLKDEVERLQAYGKNTTLLKAELDQLRFENKRLKKGLRV